MSHGISESFHYGAHTIECTLKAIARMFMTTVLATEAIFRKIIESVYNFISFVLQLVTFIPMMLFFCVAMKVRGLCTSCRFQKPLLSFIFCECLMSALFIALLIFTLSLSGHLDTILMYFRYWRGNTTMKLLANPPSANSNTILISHNGNRTVGSDKFDIEKLLQDLHAMTNNNLNNTSAAVSTKLHKSMIRLFVSKIIKKSIITSVCERTDYFSTPTYLSTIYYIDILNQN